MSKGLKTAGMLILTVLLCGGVSFAGQLAQGESEMTASFSFSDMSFDGGGDTQEIDLSVGWGYMLTNTHEVGGALGYFKIDEDAFDTDGGSLSAFYHYNFTAGQNMNPYLGVNATTYFGDLGDVFDMGYGVEAGIKVWPWDHGGYSFGLKWSSIDTAFGGSVDSLDAFLGIMLKY